MGHGRHWQWNGADDGRCGGDCLVDRWGSVPRKPLRRNSTKGCRSVQKAEVPVADTKKDEPGINMVAQHQPTNTMLSLNTKRGYCRGGPYHRPKQAIKIMTMTMRRTQHEK